jgi:hypothetical protein
MLCVKTGAKVFIYELGATVAADIYRVGPVGTGTVVIRWTLGSERHCGPIKARAEGATHFVLEGPKQSDDWCREDIGVIVTQRYLLEGETDS